MILVFFLLPILACISVSHFATLVSMDHIMSHNCNCICSFNNCIFIVSVGKGVGAFMFMHLTQLFGFKGLRGECGANVAKIMSFLPNIYE